MLKHKMAATLVGLGLCASVASAQPPATTTTTDPQMTVNQRLENQKDRVQAGTKDDQLTKGERTKLRADDAAIKAQEKVPSRERRQTDQERKATAQYGTEQKQPPDLSRSPQCQETEGVAASGAMLA